MKLFILSLCLLSVGVFANSKMSCGGNKVCPSGYECRICWGIDCFQCIKSDPKPRGPVCRQDEIVCHLRWGNYYYCTTPESCVEDNQW